MAGVLLLEDAIGDSAIRRAQRNKDIAMTPVLGSDRCGRAPELERASSALFVWRETLATMSAFSVAIGGKADMAKADGSVRF